MADEQPVTTVRCSAKAAPEPLIRIRYRAAEARRLGVDSVFFSMDRASELQAALKGNNIPRAAALVAETRLSLEEQGKRTIYRGKTYYDLGWRDIEHFRSNENAPIPKAEGVSNP